MEQNAVLTEGQNDGGAPIAEFNVEEPAQSTRKLIEPN